MTFVLHASALIAYLRQEPNAHIVKNILLSGADCMVHAVNLCEVYYDFLRAGGPSVADQAVLDVRAIGVIVVEDMDETFWKDVGWCKANHQVSFADYFAIALARKESAEVVTSDHREFEPVQRAGVCRVFFFR